MVFTSSVPVIVILLNRVTVPFVVLIVEGDPVKSTVEPASSKLPSFVHVPLTFIVPMDPTERVFPEGIVT